MLEATESGDESSDPDHGGPDSYSIDTEDQTGVDDIAEYRQLLRTIEG